MSTANQHSQTSVQRLRSKEIATLLPGSQLPAPRTLRPERPSGLNMPHPTRPVVQGKPRCSAATAMGQRAAVKRWPTAQIAASPPPVPTRDASEGWHPALSFRREGSGTPPKSTLGLDPRAGVTVKSWGRRAFAHHTTLPSSTAARAEAWQGTIPPFFLLKERP